MLEKVKMCKRIFSYQTKDEGDIPFYKIGTFGKRPDANLFQRSYTMSSRVNIHSQVKGQY